MGYAKHIGRVGVLAVALGIGSAVAGPQVALAEDGGSSTSSSASDSASRAGSADSPGARSVRSARTVRSAAVPRTSAASSHAEEDAETEQTDDPDQPLDTEPVAPAPVTEAVATSPEPTSAVPRSKRTAPISVRSARTSGLPSSHTDAGPETAGTITGGTAAEPAAATATAVAAVAPQVSIVVSTKPSQARPPLRPVRQLVLGVLGVFGFKPNPAPGTANNPILEGLWGAYRRIESLVSNDTPTVKGAAVVDTSLTTDGRVAVTLRVEFDDYDGNALSYTTTDGAHGTLTRNTDGTYTYLTDASTAGDTVSITARDKGFHLHGLLGMFKPGGGHTSTATLTLTLDPVGEPPVTDVVISTPRTGNSWTVRVPSHNPEVTLTAGQPGHVEITRATDGSYLVTVTDSAWALANPGTQITVVATATTRDVNGEIQTVSSTVPIGTVSNLMTIGGYLQPPALPPGTTWVQARSSSIGEVLLRSDGAAFLVDIGITGPIVVPELPAGLTYTQVAAGDGHYVLLRSDGTAIAIAGYPYLQPALNIPDLPAGLTYTQVAAGADHTVLLRSDGAVIAIGTTLNGETEIPDLPAGQTYTQVSAAGYVTVLLRSDGTAVAIGINELGQTDVPAPPSGVNYIQVATGAHHTVLLHSDGNVTAVGYNSHGQLQIPDLPDGMTYVQVDAGHTHTVLLRSDGAVIAIGWVPNGIPTLPDGVVYTAVSADHSYTTVLFSRV
ncbi:hypothetical protein GCM10010409_17700 [Mycolicibacterium diernhoferi]